MAQIKTFTEKHRSKDSLMTYVRTFSDCGNWEIQKHLYSTGTTRIYIFQYDHQLKMFVNPFTTVPLFVKRHSKELV